MLTLASRNLRNNKEIVYEAIKNFGFAIKFASKVFKDNERFGFLALKTSGYVLNHLSQNLKKNKKIVEFAVRKNGYAIQYADKSIFKDKKFIIKILSFYLGGTSFAYIDTNLKENKKVILAAAKTYGFVIREIKKNSKIFRDREILKACLGQIGLSLKYLNKEMKNDQTSLSQLNKMDTL